MLVISEVQTPEQLEQARALVREYAQTRNFQFCFQTFDQELANLGTVYGPPQGRLYLALWEGLPAGVAGLHAIHPSDAPEGTCEIKRLYVRPEFRGHSIGRKIVERVIEDARTIGYKRMRLDTIPSDMAQAIALYRSIGFRDIPPYCESPVKEAIYMELAI